MPMAEFRLCMSFFIGQLQGLRQIAHWLFVLHFVWSGSCIDVAIPFSSFNSSRCWHDHHIQSRDCFLVHHLRTVLILMPDHRSASLALDPLHRTILAYSFVSSQSTGMDVNEFSIRGDVDCRKPRLVHTSESSNHNGHVSTINLSYQVICLLCLNFHVFIFTSYLCS